MNNFFFGSKRGVHPPLRGLGGHTKQREVNFVDDGQQGMRGGKRCNNKEQH